MVNGAPEQTRLTSLSELLPDAFRPAALLESTKAEKG
jgi:hypothetical protein